jgi:protein involved in polysaccharide export with SLBB domain
MSTRVVRSLTLLALALVTVSTSGCFLRRPDFMIRTHPREVPLADGSRAQIADRVAELEAQLANGSVRGGERDRAQRELERLRQRLTEGDFQVGDQLVVTISREQVSVDTATVREGLTIGLASQGELPPVSLAGALRNEAQQRVQSHLDRYLKDFTVRVTLLTRLQVTGGVGRPGYYGVSPDRPVTDILMAAGGPTPLARLDRVTIRRDGQLIVKGSQWRTAVREGTTIAELGLQPGDEIAIEQRGQRMSPWQTAQLILFTISGTFALIQLLTFIYSEDQ